MQLGVTEYLSLAEVEVYGVATDLASSNLAPAGIASQSSTDFDGAAGRAIDGNTDGRYNRGSVTHTEREPEPWWELALSAPTDIQRIVLFNRSNGCCDERLRDVYVFVSENPFDDNASVEELQNNPEIWYQFLPGSQGSRIDLPVNATGSYVRVQLGVTEYLSLAEVEVYGEALDIAPEVVEVVEVADVVDLPVAGAISALAPLSAEQSAVAFSDVIDEGSVISQNPTAGTEVTDDTVVQLIVSRGAEQPITVEVADVIDTPLATAITALLPLIANQSAEEFSDSVVAGHVITQSPMAGYL